MKSHQFAELVNALRDTSMKFAGHQQLRERIVRALFSHGIYPDNGAVSRCDDVVGYYNDGSTTAHPQGSTPLAPTRKRAPGVPGP